MRGFIVSHILPPQIPSRSPMLTCTVQVMDPDMGPKYTEDHQKNLQKWIHDGSFKALQSVTHGIDKSGEGLIGMLEGKNFGKAVLEVSQL